MVETLLKRHRSFDIFDSGYIPPDLKVVFRLNELIETHFRREQDAEFYVEQLGYTVKRMNILTRNYIGLTVYELIQKRIHEEAMKLVQYTTLTVKEITEELGLCDPSWFCRCFKKETGMTPMALRKQLKSGSEIL